MINRILKLGYVSVFALIFFVGLSLSYNISFADHCSSDPTDDSCHCPSGQSWNGSSCVNDTCNNGATNPPSCDTCPAGKQLEDGSCVDVCVLPETGDYPECGECTSDQTGIFPNCVDNVCVYPDEGTPPNCGQCDVSGTSGYPECYCANTGNPPEGDPLSCTAPITYCCDDDTALNYDDTDCPDPENYIEVDNTTCEFCTANSTDPSCIVKYCPADDPGGVACQAAEDLKPHPGNCEDSDTACTYYYCGDPLANNQDAGPPVGNACKVAHPVATCTEDNPNECEYPSVEFCDDARATNKQTQAECEADNSPKSCVVNNASVCEYIVEGCRPDDTNCFEFCSGSSVVFTNGDPTGAACVSEHPSPAICAPDASICTPYFTCTNLIDASITCPSGFYFEQGFTHSYRYNPDTQSCVAPLPEYLIDLENYLEGMICGSGGGNVPVPADIDWCSDIAGVQTNPADCPYDVCPDIAGVQTTEDECSIIGDLCPDVDGIQTSVPDGRCMSGNSTSGYTCPIIPTGSYANEDGLCTEIDICSDVAGAQTSVPLGRCLDESGSGECPIDTEGNGCGSRYGTAACGSGLSIPQPTISSITGTVACSVGAFGGYVSYNAYSNRYGWDCFGSMGSSAYCTAPKGNAPVCGVATSNTYKLSASESSIGAGNLCSYGTVSGFSKIIPYQTVTPSTTPPSGETTINWNCNLNTATTACSTRATGCDEGYKWCQADGNCVLESAQCPAEFLDVSPVLKTTGLLNQNDQQCIVYIEDSITVTGGATNVLCNLKNITLGANVEGRTNFNPSLLTTYNAGAINRDTVFQLTCGRDEPEEGEEDGDGILDASEEEGDPAVGSCRLNIESTEFN